MGGYEVSPSLPHWPPTSLERPKSFRPKPSLGLIQGETKAGEGKELQGRGSQDLQFLSWPHLTTYSLHKTWVPPSLGLKGQERDLQSHTMPLQQNYLDLLVWFPLDSFPICMSSSHYHLCSWPRDQASCIWEQLQGSLAWRS